MAVFKSIFGTILGKIGGAVFGRGMSGSTIKANTMPTINYSKSSIMQRQSWGYLSAYWKNTLTSAQQERWNLWASNSALINRFGEPFFSSGLNCFIRHNVGLLKAGMSVSATPPASYGWRVSTTVDSASDLGSSSLQVATIPVSYMGDAGVGEAYNVFISPSLRNVGSKPVKQVFVGTVAFDADSPIVFPAPFTFVSGDYFHVTYRIIGNVQGYSNPYSNYYGIS